MTNGFGVAAEQIRAHARNVEAVQQRFGAVKAASAHIERNDAAYGLLCRWIAAVLESRHTRQDELYAYVEENLALVVQALRQTADGYDNVDSRAAQRLGASYRPTGQQW
ncbi:type VII secretion target [Plantactinospora sp. B5E13]|uniref:type VII secretion target n=1 Tax=Plantactinospora sp. B5E13 TaxID=3153758 RepID=UPI00325CE66D